MRNFRVLKINNNHHQVKYNGTQDQREYILRTKIYRI
jgi:hypothetical protein